MAPIQPTLDSIRRLLELGKTSEALGQLEDFLEQNPRQVEAWWLAAQNVKSDDKKRICLQRILTLEPDHRGARAEMIALDGLDGEVSSATTSHSKSDAKQENGRKSMRTPDASGESYDDGLGEDDFDEIQVIEEEQETYAIASASSANAASSDGDVFDFSGPAKKPKSKARKDAATDWEDEYEEDEYEEYVEPETILGIPTTWIICAQLGIILLLVTTFAWSHYSTVAQIGKLEKKIGYLESDVSEATKVTDEQIRHMKDVQQSIEDVASQSSSLSTKLKSTNEVAHEAHQIAAASDRRVDNALTSSERAIKEAQDAKDSALESLDSVREIEQEVFELQQITSAVMQGELEEADAEGEAKNGNEEVANGDKKPEEVAVVERPLRLRRPAPKPRPPVDKNGEIRVKLPHPVVDVVPADGGKLLVLKLESLSGLLVFDTQQARLAGTISLPSEDFLYAAGGQKVLIYFKENGLMQVWNLYSRNMLKAKPNPVGTTVTTLTMGHSNDRLALVRAAIGTDALSGSGSYLMDLRSLEPVRGSEPTKNENNPRHIIFPIRGHNSSFRDFVHRRANGDMSLVTEWCTSHSPTGVGLIRITGTKSDSKYEHTSAGFLAIGDDNRVYTSGGQIMNSQLTAIGRVSGGVPIPDIGGSFMVTMDANEPKVYASGSTKPIVTLPKLNGFGLSQDAWTRSSFTMDRRIVFAPQLEYLIYIPIANDEIVLRPFDLDTALRDSGVDYLIVTSSPDGNVTPGRLWTYSLDVIQNKNSKLKYSLQAAPDGMTISPSGDISWKVPRNFDQSVDVIVLVENSNFDSTFHNFELRPE